MMAVPFGNKPQYHETPSTVTMTDSFQRIKYPELFIGFVAPIGARIDKTLESFRRYFENRHYQVIDVKVTNLFNALAAVFPSKVRLNASKPYERFMTYIAYGNQLRADLDDNILAQAAVAQIVAKRVANQQRGQEYERTVFLVHQFKRKEEIDLLRTVYGRLFFQVSVYSRRGARLKSLSELLARGDNSSDSNSYVGRAGELIQKDENERGESHGQRVAEIFHDADFIVNTDIGRTEDQVERFGELLFGSNCISPTKMEYGMYLAKAAALRTLDLSRQVGAAIIGDTGEVISLGTNEVPKAGGGTYWPDEAIDDRDYKREVDSNAKRKRQILAELAEIIKPGTNMDQLIIDRRIRDSQFMGALEYGRIVHAEMNALMDAARMGLSVKERNLYCTTFPCHLCAKHIVASGIDKVIFLEPYPKSLASDLHSDSIEVEGNERGEYEAFPSVTFEHFHGVSPRRYREIFERLQRKSDEHGGLIRYREGGAQPIVEVTFPYYNRHEGFLLKFVQEQLHLDEKTLAES